MQTEHKTLAAYVLAGIVDNYPAGQEAALQVSLTGPLFPHYYFRFCSI